MARRLYPSADGPAVSLFPVSTCAEGGMACAEALLHLRCPHCRGTDALVEALLLPSCLAVRFFLRAPYIVAVPSAKNRTFRTLFP